MKPDSAPLPALPMPRGVRHASMISASTMVFPRLVYELVVKSHSIALAAGTTARAADVVLGRDGSSRPQPVAGSHVSATRNARRCGTCLELRFHIWPGRAHARPKLRKMFAVHHLSALNVACTVRAHRASRWRQRDKLLALQISGAIVDGERREGGRRTPRSLGRHDSRRFIAKSQTLHFGLRPRPHAAQHRLSVGGA